MNADMIRIQVHEESGGVLGLVGALKRLHGRLGQGMTSKGDGEQDRLVAVVLDEPPIFLLLFLDPSLREHVADDGTVVGAIETLCSHPLVLG